MAWNCKIVPFLTSIKCFQCFYLYYIRIDTIYIIFVKQNDTGIEIDANKLKCIYFMWATYTNYLYKLIIRTNIPKTIYKVGDTEDNCKHTMWEFTPEYLYTARKYLTIIS